ncbi:hypothetical protein V3391_00935 [Luteimonas sp. SMYT11W]|uniref:Uncharacterized protein n=1 Tax=Luteimonas flava TaxID=3115822 RepID=A0ABU7WAW0_9GAMM
MTLLYSLTFRIPFTSRALSILPATKGQQGFWLDRSHVACVVLAVGRWHVYIERQAGPLLRYCG